MFNSAYFEKLIKLNPPSCFERANIAFFVRYFFFRSAAYVGH